MTSPLIGINTLISNPEAWTILEASDGLAQNGATATLRQRYDQNGHIPGARFADLVNELSDPHALFPFARPSAQAFTAAIRRLGIDNYSKVVIYDRSNGIWAARVWWLLKSFGHSQTYVLEGGYQAWASANFPLQTELPVYPPGNFTAVTTPGYFVDLPYVQEILNGQHNAQLVNVLRRSVFRGEESKYARPGHIPQSINLPYIELLDASTRTFINATALRAALQPLMGQPAVQQVLYCGSGITAAGVALALATVGVHHVAVYDGSLSEWSADPTLPMSLSGTPSSTN